MPGRPDRIYWDACVFLDYIEAHPEWTPTLDALVDRALAAEIVIVTSTISITEVAFGKAERTGRTLDPAIEAKMESLWNDPAVIVLVEFDQLIARAARSLVRSAIDTGRKTLKPMDAIHLASAQRARVSAFHTTDDVLKNNWQDLGFPVHDPIAPQPKLFP